MSFAQNYTPTVGFATEETNSVAGRSTVRTVAIDNELANISSSINGLNTNIKLLQRDDGKPKDFLIEPYALSEQSRALISTGGIPKGIWNASTNYSVGDSITNLGIAYLCITSHISASIFDANLWMAISGDGSSATSAAASAASAVSAAASAASITASAATATTKAAEAVASAATATTKATEASNSAALALTNKNSTDSNVTASANSAATASAQAGIATSAAYSTAGSVAAAAASASTATTEAGIATTQAGIATAQAAIATAQTSITSSNTASVTSLVNSAMSAGLASAASNASAAQASADAAAAAWTAAIAADNGLNPAVRMNPNNITVDMTIPTDYNAYSAGPITIAEGINVTLNDNSEWSIL